MTTRYLIRCAGCDSTIDETADKDKADVVRRCVPCSGFTKGRTVWVKGTRGRFREAIITWSRSYDQCVSIRPVTYKSKGIERWHHHLVLLELPKKV